MNCPKCNKDTAKASTTYPDILVCYCGGSILNEVGPVLANKSTKTISSQTLRNASQIVQNTTKVLSLDTGNESRESIVGRIMTAAQHPQDIPLALDLILPTVYMRAYGIDYNKACAKAKKAVDAWLLLPNQTSPEGIKQNLLDII